jgi:hypothetical protein
MSHEVGATDQFHCEEKGLSLRCHELVEAYEVRVAYVDECPKLLFEQKKRIGADMSESLQSDVPASLVVECFVDRPHAAARNVADDFVTCRSPPVDAFLWVFRF